jgi:DNA polymerase III epsilon subunit-like protein
MAELHDFIGDLRIVAYNAPFDMAFLNNAAKQFDLKINNQRWPRLVGQVRGGNKVDCRL